MILFLAGGAFFKHKYYRIMRTITFNREVLNMKALVNFYFEFVGGKQRYMIMQRGRMKEIFEAALADPKITMQDVARIKAALKELAK